MLVAIVLANLLAGREGLLWRHGLPVGHDFHIFYTAARAAADGRLSEIFVPERLWAMAQEYLGARFATNGLWLYPPHYLLLIAPLALLPYLTAYLTFAAVTLAAYLAAAWHHGLRQGWFTALIVAPTTAFTIMAGQNGLFTGALIVSGIVLMQRRPYTAGVLLGVLTVKPHLVLLAAVAVAAARAWRCGATAIVTALSLAAVATAAYGVGAWTGPLTETLPVLTQGVGGVARYWATGFASIYPHAAMAVGAGVLAWIGQAVAALAAAVATWRVCRRSSDDAERAAIVSVGTMLTVPYLFFYDLPMVTLTAALYAHSRPHLARADVALLVMLAFTPLLVISGIPLLAPAAIVAAFCRLWWRAEHVLPPACAGAVARAPLSSSNRVHQDATVRPASYGLLVLVAGAVVYAHALTGPFILDDDAAIVSNPAVRTLSGALDAPRDTPIAGRPVVALTFAMNYALGGLAAAGYRATNVAIHVACALLLFGVARRTFGMPRLQRFGAHGSELALGIAVLWAVHPLNTEAVTYITQRTESLMALFFLLTVYAAIRGAASVAGSKWEALAVVSCWLGMGCKETMATAPVMVFLYDRVFLFASFREAFSRHLRLYAGLASSWLFVAYLVSHEPRSGSTGFSAGVDVWTYLLNQAVMVVRYLRLAFWPRDLVVNYGPPLPLTLAEVWSHALVIVCLLLLVIVAWRRKASVGFAGAWLFVTLAPASSIVPVATQMGAERRMYLPLMALVALVVAAAYGALKARMSRTGALLAFAIAATALGTATVARNRDYAVPLRLAETALERWPSDVAAGMVGSELIRLHRDEEAIPVLRQAARTDATARYNLGVALFNTGRFHDAIRELEVLVEQHPQREEVPWSRQLIGQAYAAERRYAEATAQFRAVLEMTPNDPSAKALLTDTLVAHGVESATAGRYDEAIEAFRQAVAVAPEDLRSRANLVAALIDKGDLTQATAEAQRGIALNGSDATLHDLLGRALALQARYDEAIAAFNTALKISPSDSTIREDLARVLAVIQEDTTLRRR